MTNRPRISPANTPPPAIHQFPMPLYLVCTPPTHPGFTRGGCLSGLTRTCFVAYVGVTLSSVTEPSVPLRICEPTPIASGALMHDRPWTDRVIDWDFPQPSVSEEVLCPTQEREVSAVKCLSVEKYVEMALSYATLLTGSDLPSPDPEVLRAKLLHLSDVFSKDKAVQRAAEWANDFEWDRGQIRADTDLINRVGIEAAVTHVQDIHRPDRLNAERVVKNFHPSTFERYELLLELATTGGKLCLPDDFVPTPTPPKVRNLHTRLGKCPSKHASALRAKDRGLLFYHNEVDTLQLSYVSSHWTVKVCNNLPVPEGRWLVAPTFNSRVVKERAKAYYGPIKPDQLTTMFADWKRFIDVNGYALEDCRISKEDIPSAFNQVLLEPASARKLCVQLDENVSMVLACAGFGANFTPYGFDVIGDAAKMRMDRVVAEMAKLHRYVDDYLNFSHKSVADAVQEMVRTELETTLGPRNGFDPKKSHPPSVEQTVLGCLCNLQTGLVRPSDLASEKLLFVFFTVDLDESHPLRVYQCLASLAERYSRYMRGMRPFVSALDSMCRSFGSGASMYSKSCSKSRDMAMLSFSPAAKFCVEMWRVGTSLMWLSPDRMSVPIFSTIPGQHGGPIQGFIQTDAGKNKTVIGSENRIGSVLWNTDRTQVLAHCSYVLPFTDDVSALYQNCREYIGLLLGKVMAAAYFAEADPSKVIPLLWLGDNKSALHWAAREKAKSRGAQFSCLAHSWFDMFSMVSVRECEYVPTELMGAADDLSRNRLSSPELEGSAEFNFNGSQWVNDLFALCDPVLGEDTVDHHKAFQSIHFILTMRIPLHK